MENNFSLYIFKSIVANPSEDNFKLARWLYTGEVPSRHLHQFWLRVEMGDYKSCSLMWREASRILVINYTFLMLGLPIQDAWSILEAEPFKLKKGSIMPHELQDLLDELHAKLEIVGEGLDLFNALKKVHKHIHENPENLLFLKDEQIAEIVHACEVTQDLTIKTTAKKTPRAKSSNDLNIQDDTLDFGNTDGMSLAALMAAKKK